MRYSPATLSIMLLAAPAAAQPFILPLQPQRPSEAPAPAPSPAPVAPPQSDSVANSQVGEPGQAEARHNDAANSSQGSGETRSENGPQAPGR